MDNIKNDRLKDLTPFMRSEFQAINPKGFTFEQAPKCVDGTLAWSHVVFGGESERLAALPEDLVITWPGEFAYHSTYRSEYIQYLNRFPDLKGFVRVEPEEDLQTAARNGLLLQIEDTRGNFLGVIAGQPLSLYGLQALYIFEIFLSRIIQGKGYAPVVESLFIQQLRPRFSFVWGNIHDHNLPSLRTAQRVGRKIIQTEFFCALNQ